MWTSLTNIRDSASGKEKKRGKGTKRCKEKRSNQICRKRNVGTIYHFPPEIYKSVAEEELGEYLKDIPITYFISEH